jgi:hypothetical protein
MSSAAVTRGTSTGTTPPGRLEVRLEVEVVPVSDVDRAKEFFASTLGFHHDANLTASDGLRIVQVTPSGSACSEIETTRAELRQRRPRC